MSSCSLVPLRGVLLLAVVLAAATLVGCGETGLPTEADQTIGGETTVTPAAAWLAPTAPPYSKTELLDALAACVVPHGPGGSPGNVPLAQGQFHAGPRTPQWPLKASRVLYTDAQIAAARQLCDTDSGAMAIKNRIVQQAAYWMAIPDEELFLRLPDSSVPRAFDVSESGCPVHG
ncbi:MAG TPA: hypothetical protein VMV94_06030, partial [Phycisphaerae bacterium]|nr:hypothetical protein [Phycisphaerae bacterium]